MKETSASVKVVRSPNEAKLDELIKSSSLARGSQ